MQGKEQIHPGKRKLPLSCLGGDKGPLIHVFVFSFKKPLWGSNTPVWVTLASLSDALLCLGSREKNGTGSGGLVLLIRHYDWEMGMGFPSEPISLFLKHNSYSNCYLNIQ